MVEVIKKIAIDGIAYDVAGGGSTPAGEIDAKDVSFTAEMSSLVSDNVADALEEIAENETLENLKDTSIQTPEQGEVVMFDSTTNKWHNTPLTTLNEGEPTVDGEYVGQMYKNTTSGVMYIRNGEEWKEQNTTKEVMYSNTEEPTEDGEFKGQITVCKEDDPETGFYSMRIYTWTGSSWHLLASDNGKREVIEKDLITMTESPTIGHTKCGGYAKYNIKLNNRDGSNSVRIQIGTNLRIEEDGSGIIYIPEGARYSLSKFGSPTGTATFKFESLA